MTNQVPPEQRQTGSDVKEGVIKRLRQIVRFVLLLWASLFVAAGRLDWPMAWALLGAYVISLLVGLAVILPRHAEVIAERGERMEDAKGWDKTLATVYVLLSTLGLMLAAGLGQRLGGSRSISIWVEIAALAAVPLAYGLIIWAMASNKHFEGLVRIQEERDHRVATGGPYRYVRHPGYVGMIGQSFSMSLALGSLWAVGVAGVATALLVLRTELEDKTLQEELDGYKEYARRVRYRLLPGIW